MRNYTECEATAKIRSCKIRDCQGEDSLVYVVQQEKNEDGEAWRILHRKFFLPCEAILEDPKGFHLNKE